MLNKAIKNYVGTIFGNFQVIEDLGCQFATKKSKVKNRFLIIKCNLCNIQFKTTLNNVTRLSPNTCNNDHKSNKQLPKYWRRLKTLHFKMIKRCHDPNDKSFPRYGNKGIKVCKEWHTFKNFYNWAINNGHLPNLSIDRIDNDKGYCPINCRWITQSEQSRNRKHVISEYKVRKIKKLLNDGFTHNVIADLMSTTKSRVSDISCGTSWVNII
jgi:hypothetical protein